MSHRCGPQFVAGFGSWLPSFAQGNEESAELNYIAKSKFIIKKSWIQKIIDFYGLAGSSHIFSQLEAFEENKGGIETVSKRENFFGDFFILEDQFGALGNKSIQMIIFHHEQDRQYWITQIQSQLKYVSNEEIDSLAKKISARLQKLTKG